MALLPPENAFTRSTTLPAGNHTEVLFRAPAAILARNFVSFSTQLTPWCGLRDYAPTAPISQPSVRYALVLCEA